MSSIDRAPVSKEESERVRESYAKGLGKWLVARKSRWGYLVPVDASDPRFKRIDQMTLQLVRMMPQAGRVVDLGFGPEGRDMADVLTLGQGKKLQVRGVELVPENIASTMKNPRFQRGDRNLLEGNIQEADIVQGIPCEDESADAIILSSVIQHIEPEKFYKIVLPDLMRVLRPGGILQLLFKSTEGEEEQTTIEDSSMGGKKRQFYLYNPQTMLQRAAEIGLELYPNNKDSLGGVLRWKDQLRSLPYAGMYLVKKNENPKT